MKKEKWYGQPGIYGIFITIITIGLLFAWFIKVQQQGNYQWQCVEWKNNILYKINYIYDYSGINFLPCWDNVKQLYFGIPENGLNSSLSPLENCEVRGGVFAYTEGIWNEKWINSITKQVCVKEGKNCRNETNKVIKVYFWELVNNATKEVIENKTISEWVTETKTVCEEYRDLI